MCSTVIGTPSAYRIISDWILGSISKGTIERTNFIFRDTLKITNKLVLTNVNCEIEGDVFYPDIDFNEWQEKSSENFSKDIDNDYDFKVRVLERV